MLVFSLSFLFWFVVFVFGVMRGGGGCFLCVAVALTLIIQTSRQKVTGILKKIKFF
jgi:hypothetical protein